MNVSEHGNAVEIAVGLRERQFDIYRSQSVHMPTYAEVRKSFEVLNFIHSNHIHSLDDMRACLAAANRKEDIAMHRYFSLANKKEQLKTLDYLGDSEVDMFDYVILTNYFNNKIIFNDLQMKSADCLADGVVSVSDAVILVRYINRKCDTLPLSPDDL